MNKFTITIIFSLFSFYVYSNTIFVNNELVSGLNNGTSWENAFTNLHDGLNSAENGDEVWIAKGTYLPTLNNDRYIYFEQKTGVSIYGGFSGTENAKEQRDLENSETILSGDIGESGLFEDNSFTILYMPYPNENTILDGVTITLGNANSEDPSDLWTTPPNCAGGLYIMGENSEVYVNLQNCKFLNNFGEWYGGGVFYNIRNEGKGHLEVDNCSFFKNEAYEGAAIHISGDLKELSLSHCTFQEYLGTAVRIYNRSMDVNVKINHCSFSDGDNGISFNYNSLLGIKNYDFEIKECSFFNNSKVALGIGGGDLDNSSSLNFSMEDCSFVNNGIAELPSGTISFVCGIGGFNEIAINKCNFHSNFRSCLNVKGELTTVSKLILFDNYVKDKWDKLVFFRGEEINLSNSNFTGNEGTILYVDSGTENKKFKLSNSVFQGNKIKGETTNTYITDIQGTLFFEEGNGEFEVINCNFIENESIDILAYSPEESSETRVSVINSLFQNENSLYPRIQGGNSIIDVDYSLFNQSDCQSIYDSLFFYTSYPDVDSSGNVYYVVDSTFNGIFSCGENVLYSQNQVFTHWEEEDYSLINCSVAIDAGLNTPLVESNINFDFFQQDRIVNEIVDLGAFEKESLLINLLSVLPTICGEATGEIEFEINNGCPPYEISLKKDNEIFNDLENLPSGTYNIKVTDALGKEESKVVQVNSHSNLDYIIYPTIARSNTEIQLRNCLKKEINFTLFNALGERLLEEISSDESIYFQAPSLPGAYYVRIEDGFFEKKILKIIVQ